VQAELNGEVGGKKGIAKRGTETQITSGSESPSTSRRKEGDNIKNLSLGTGSERRICQKEEQNEKLKDTRPAAQLEDVRGDA